MYENKYHTIDLSKISILVTGGAGFIGSNIIEYLVKYNIGKVRVLDNFSNGYKSNIEEFLELSNLELIEGDIRDLETCQKASKNMDYILHQAALGSVPRSINNPITTNEVNINGFLNMLVAAKDQKVKRFIYAASSSTYGDSQELPKIEDRIGKPLSPYAVTKYVNELYADVFSKTYGLESVGLRYFNVFGPKQSPNGAYAAVIPLFINAIINNEKPIIFGNGEVSRDFTFVENVVQANIKSLFVDNPQSINQVYNIACGERNNLIELLEKIGKISNKNIEPIKKESRRGDIMHSLASIAKAKKGLNYQPFIKIEKGLELTIDWLKKSNEVFTN